MKRQRGRNRSGGGGGGGKPQQNANRAFESNGPDNLKIRGHAQHVFEKYQQLARDATSAGDRVLAENFLQHAEHYFRLIRTLQPNRPYTDIVSREGFVSGYDIDFEDDSEGGEYDGGGETQEGQPGEDRSDYRDQPREGRWENRNGDGRPEQNRSDQNRSDNRQDQPRQERPPYGARNNSNNNGANNGGRPRDDRNFNRDRNDGRWENRNGERNENGRYADNRGERTETPEGEERRPDRSEQGQRSDSRDRYERRPERSFDRNAEPRAEQPARDPMPVIEPQATPLTPSRPEPAAGDDRVLRSQDGGVSHAPAFLQSASAAPDEAAVKRPRGRPRKKVEEAASETEV